VPQCSPFARRSCDKSDGPVFLYLSADDTPPFCKTTSIGRLEQTLLRISVDGRLLKIEAAGRKPGLALSASERQSADACPELTKLIAAMLDSSATAKPCPNCSTPACVHVSSSERPGFTGTHCHLLPLTGDGSKGSLSDADFFTLAAHREALRLGQPSQDEIMMHYHFENVNRKHDSTTEQYETEWAARQLQIEKLCAESSPAGRFVGRPKAWLAFQVALFFVAARICGGIHFIKYIPIIIFLDAEQYCTIRQLLN
jgi:hypothetical protein